MLQSKYNHAMVVSLIANGFFMSEIDDTFTPLVRASSSALDSILGKKFPVLDDIGFLRCVDYMGTDDSIVQAARVSYGDGTKTPSDDETLIRYLVRHQHTTPLEMCVIKFHVKLPIFVARQWVRHRMSSMNEYSARYSVMKEEFYIPEVSEICVQSVDNKQGRGDVLESGAAICHGAMRDCSVNAFALYEDLLTYDVSREQARIILPLNTYTEFYWKIDLHNLFHFLKLRADSHAQYEIRMYAEVMLEIIKDWVPMAYGAFKDYVQDAETFSGPALALLKRLIHSEIDIITQEKSGLGKREYSDLMKVLG
jgi:thymidylate synthase (FAD)